MEQNNEPSYSLFSYTSSENHYNFWNTTIGSFSFGIGVFTPMPNATYLHVQCITLWSLSSFFTRGMLVFFPIILVKILQYTNKWNQFHVYTFFIYIYTHTHTISLVLQTEIFTNKQDIFWILFKNWIFKMMLNKRLIHEHSV